jgi:hypothetical protein
MTEDDVSSDSAARTAKIAVLRKATINLVAGIVALDATAMAIYYLAGIPHRDPTTRNTFVVIWMVATALVVAFLLRKVRQARFVPPRRR